MTAETVKSFIELKKTMALHCSLQTKFESVNLPWDSTSRFQRVRTKWLDPYQYKQLLYSQKLATSTLYISH